MGIRSGLPILKHDIYIAINVTFYQGVFYLLLSYPHTSSRFSDHLQLHCSNCIRQSQLMEKQLLFRLFKMAIFIFQKAKMPVKRGAILLKSMMEMSLK